MAKHKEIEIKWFAESVGRDTFNNKLQDFLKEGKYLYEYVRAIGPDVYYSDGKGRTLRHRKSEDTHELTSKMRLYKNSIKARKEVNVKLALDQPIENIEELMDMLGLSKELEIIKDCDIYFIKGSTAHVSIVWYMVQDSSGGIKRFMEVEVEGLSHMKSLKAVEIWAKRLEKMFGLTKKDVSLDSLYEIYSGKKYEKV